MTQLTVAMRAPVPAPPPTRQVEQSGRGDRGAVSREARSVCALPRRLATPGEHAQRPERLALAPVDLMVLDLNMPDMHGLEVLDFLRRHQAYSRIPVIVLTTRGDEASRADALAAGASVYLTKPFAPQSLAAQAEALLKAHLERA